MQVIIEPDEANSLMAVITSGVIDHAGLSAGGKAAVRRWRSSRALGSREMEKLADAMNRALGQFVEEKTDRTVRRKGRYVRSRDLR